MRATGHGVGHEERIVAESALSARLPAHPPLARPLGDRLDTILIYQDDHASKARCTLAFWHVAQSAQQSLVVGGISGTLAS